MLQELRRALCSSSMRTCYLFFLSLFTIVIIICGYLAVTPVSPFIKGLIRHRTVSSVSVYRVLYYSDQLKGEEMPRADLLKEGGVHHRNVSSMGFLMGLDYSDQLTSGGMNLFCLQCLARAMDHRLEVAEPFIVNSTFGVPLDISYGNPAVVSPLLSSALKLRDVYDLEKWVSYTEEKHFAPLVSWERFLDAAPRSVVLVQHAWGECSLIQLEEKCSPLLQLIKFNVIRKVCVCFKSSGVLDLQQYKRKVYGTLNPANVTVIFDRWMGVGPYVDKYIVSIKGSQCVKAIGVPLFSDLHVVPSKRLERDVAKYVSRYLSKAEDNMYIAVMVRTEMVILEASNKTDRLRLISQCVDNVVQKWTYMKKHSGLNKTFVALDYGNYGSKGYYLHSFMNLSQLEMKVEQLLQSLEQGRLQEWEKRFREVTSSQNPGYVASLQKAIASNARCLITSGGGTFQDHALALHQKIYGKTCLIRLKNDCELLDTQVSLPPPPLS